MMLGANGGVSSPRVDRGAPATPLAVWNGRVRRSIGASPDAAAREFLDSYLAVSYGHAPPRVLRPATAAPRTRFTRFPIHVSAAAAGRSPRVVTLHVRHADAGRAAEVPMVDDGRLTYPVTFELRHEGHRWLVTTLTAN
jgi:hypothetical protein